MTGSDVKIILKSSIYQSSYMGCLEELVYASKLKSVSPKDIFL